MDWSWMSLVLLLFISVLHRDFAVAACDDDCQAALTREIRSILKQELQPLNLILNELKPIYEFLNDKLKPLDVMQQEIGSIRRDTRDMYVMSEEILQHTQIVVTKQESMSSDLQSLPELNNKLSLLATNITNVKYDTEILKESNVGINTSVVSIEDSVKSVKIKSRKTSRIIMQMQQDMKGLESSLGPISENKTLDSNTRLRTSGQPASGDLLGRLGDCLSLLVSEEAWRNDTCLPFHPHDGSDIQMYPLCERILQDMKTLKDPIFILEENISTNKIKTETNISLRLDTIEQSLSTLQEAVGPVQDSNSKKYSLLVLVENIFTNLTKFEKRISTSMDAIETGISITKYRVSCLGGLDGFFSLSSQCYKIFTDKQLNWADAKSLCESHGFFLAEPSDSDAAELRIYVIEKYGNKAVWLGAKADGSKWVWQDSGLTLQNSNTLWYPHRSPGSYTTTKYCLLLLSHDDNLREYPRKPYYPIQCKYIRYPLCEAK